MTQFAIDHISLTVSNLERSIDFYTKAFGFTLTSRRESDGPRLQAITGYKDVHIKVAHLDLKGVDLELIEYVNPKGEHKRPWLETKDVGTPHVGFRTTDIYRDYERLLQLGVRFKSPPQANAQTGIVAAYGLDLDGIPLELVQRP